MTVPERAKSTSNLPDSSSIESSEEVSVEALLLDGEQTPSPTQASFPPSSRLQAWKPFKWYHAWPLRFVIWRTTALLLLLAASFSTAIVVFILVLHHKHSLSLPSFCGLPGMEPYLHTSHCRPLAAHTPPALSGGFVKPGTALLDGPPPTPIYWANFQELYTLQRRMIEHSLSASVFEGTFMLKFVGDEVRRNASTMNRLRMEVQRRDPTKEECSRETLEFGARLGDQLGWVHTKVTMTVEAFLAENEEAAEWIDKCMLNQPESVLAQVISPLFPLSRYIDSIWPWMWSTDTEIRWQFYRSLVHFSWKLYEMLLLLSVLQPRIEEYGMDLDKVKSLLVEKETVNPTKSNEDEDEEYEASKNATMNRLLESGQVAFERITSSLIALRALSEEVERLRHSVAEPAPHIPHFIHLREVYNAGQRLRQGAERLTAFEEGQRKAGHESN
ncbi:hypothetical protein NMY22_g10562 [Coprinellus aureogranulatus]|nr:hypothetical protein NMY22_g10562 [Coprinellus aureogranulatus]